MRYGELLTRSFQIAWRHRYLWFLAVFAGEGAGGGGSGGNFANGLSQPGGGSMSRGPDFNAMSNAARDWALQNIGLLVAIGLLLAILFLALFVFSCIAQPALVRASAEHDAERPYSLGPALTFGLTAFWRTLGLKLLTAVLVLLVVAVFALLAVFAIGSVQANNPGGVAVALAIIIPLGLLLIPVAIVFNVAYVFAIRAIALDAMGPVAGLREGFRLIRARLGRVAIVWVIMLGVGIGIGVALLFVFLILLIPLGLLVFAAYTAAQGPGLIAGIAIAFLIVLAVGFVIGGAVGAFTSTYWTLAYRRLELEAQPAPG